MLISSMYVINIRLVQVCANWSADKGPTWRNVALKLWTTSVPMQNTEVMSCGVLVFDLGGGVGGGRKGGKGEQHGWR